MFFNGFFNLVLVCKDIEPRYGRYRICSSWTKLHNELVCLKETFLKNGYPEDFINKLFKKFMDNLHVVKETTVTVEKKPLVLVLLYLD